MKSGFRLGVFGAASEGFDPAAESRIEAGDCLIALGTAESLRKLEEMAG